MKNAPILHRLEFAAFLGVKGVLRALPHTGARRLGEALGTLSGVILRARRRVAADNLERAFPELPREEIEKLTRESFRHLGLSFCDSLSCGRFDAVEFCRRLTLEGIENLQQAEERGRGVFVMSAHLGCWEAAALPVGLYQGPMDVVGRPLDNPFLDRELTWLRTRFGNRTLDKRGAARSMMKVLRAGGRVGILIDQRPPPGDGIEVPFFGVPSRTTTVLARMSLRTEAPVVPVYGFPEPRGRYRVVLRAPIEPDRGSAETEDEAVLRLTTLYLAAVEEEIRRHPAQWMWLHARWKT
ncbi:MAG: lysophospholipid acyltransferase family protein [Acidobacteria bacterium]|nr:lysophospholipid acyltransferase family protein [Acidobacteriota bacterium]